LSDAFAENIDDSLHITSEGEAPKGCEESKAEEVGVLSEKPKASRKKKETKASAETPKASRKRKQTASVDIATETETPKASRKKQQTASVDIAIETPKASRKKQQTASVDVAIETDTPKASRKTANVDIATGSESCGGVVTFSKCFCFSLCSLLLCFPVCMYRGR
jgi:hypothetical protein